MLPGMDNDNDSAKVGKRVTAIDAETDRMARLFLGKENEEQAKRRLKIVQSNPNSHLSSAKTFQEMGLPPALLKGVQSLGFEKPSAIQEMALPMCLRRPPENLLAQAQSGSGKTAAFCLAGLCNVDTRLAMPQMLVVTPTRELAVQCVQETLLPMAKFMEPPLEVFSALKGTHPPREGIRAHVVVGTPGSVVAALDKRRLLLTHCATFVLDEADAMLEDSGDSTQHRNKCIQIKNRYLPPGQHQTLLFSATFPREVKEFGLQLAQSPVNEISLPDEQDLVLDVITQLWIDLRHTRQSRLELIQELYDVLEMGQSIIFCRTKREADVINERLQAQGFTCSVLHGSLDGVDRDATMEQFRLGHNKVLLTTNVLSRGVDVPAVSLVVNYDMPTMGYSQDPDPDTYLHRIGRTGRFGRRGVAINLIQDDSTFRVMESIDRHFSPTGSMLRQASTDVEELEKIIVEESKKRVENRDLSSEPMSQT
ncbi:DEAD box helicase [Ectocarpus siliculosus]|uniref:RNA helicase n=1 Tax=Ectocarpus siliculosus TaxID=2880 RepID=D7G332_ECTSI|nr:DEAD box helicase [Ectocarpus siliculosus]|eukprot:CBJ33475.1 DEAD box helicase [Ectocarpus siliculosus]